MRLLNINSLSFNSSFVNPGYNFQLNYPLTRNNCKSFIINDEFLTNEGNLKESKSYKQNFYDDTIENKENYNPNGMNKEIYDRLKNEKIDFIQTLLRLKQKMANKKINKTPEKQKYELDKNLNKSLTENRNNIKISNIKKFPICLNKIKKKDDNPILIKNSLRRTFISNSKNNLNLNNKNEIKLKRDKKYRNSFVQNYKNNNKNKNMRNENLIKQRTLSLNTSQNQVGNYKSFLEQKKDKNKKIKKNNHTKINSFNNISTCVTTSSINQITEIPSATINLFDE